jgi:hypothetical protein
VGSERHLVIWYTVLCACFMTPAPSVTYILTYAFMEQCVSLTLWTETFQYPHLGEDGSLIRLFCLWYLVSVQF